jgi:hypothetical protein
MENANVARIIRHATRSMEKRAGGQPAPGMSLILLILQTKGWDIDV